MKRFFALILVSCLPVLSTARADSLEDQYVHAFNLIQEADALSGADAKQAVAKYAEAQEALQKIRAANPNWNPLVVNFRVEYVAGKLVELNARMKGAPASPAQTNPPPAQTVIPPAQPAAAPPVAAPAPEPQKPAAPDERDAQIGALKEQVGQLEAERASLQAKLKEAFAARPAEADPRELARLQQKTTQLQKENDLLKVTLDSQKRSSPSPASTPAETVAPTGQAAELSRQLAQAKEQVTRLALEKEALQSRLQALNSSNGPVVVSESPADGRRIKQLELERDNLQKRLDETAKAGVAPKGKAVEARLAELQLLLDTANTRLAVYEARAVPYTAQELALLKTPAGKLASAETDAGRKPLRELSPEAAKMVATAQQQFRAGELAKAEETYQQVLHEEPESVPVLADLASIELVAGQIEPAERHILQACKLAPDSAYALSVLGRVRLRQNQYDGALDALGRAAKLEPDNAEIQNFLGLALCDKGMRLQAENALRKALELEPNYAAAHNNLAVVYLTGKPPAVELARWHYQRALDAGSPHDPNLEKMLQASR